MVLYTLQQEDLLAYLYRCICFCNPFFHYQYVWLQLVASNRIDSFSFRGMHLISIFTDVDIDLYGHTADSEQNRQDFCFASFLALVGCI
jgi:hypothetical protein